MKQTSKLDSGPVPMYMQIASKLRDRILGGEFPEGVPLPTDEVLCAEFGVSRITIRHAMLDLMARKMITRQRGRGTFVTTPDSTPGATSLVDSIHETLRYITELTYKSLLFEEVLAPPSMRGILQLEKGDRVLRVRRVGSNDEGPVVDTTLHFPGDVGRHLATRDVTSRKAMVHILEERLHTSVSHADQSVEAEVAEASTARALGIAKGSAVLKITRVFYLGDDRPIQHSVTRYHPARHAFHVKLFEKPRM